LNGENLAEHKITIEELKYRQSLPLQDKIDMSCEKIEQWYNHWNGQVYVAFSGGKDSTVLLDIVRNRAFIPDSKDIPAVFSDTGLEYPEIRDFVRTIDNVVWVRPKMSFYEVIQKYGYPVISKEQSSYIDEYRNAHSEKLKHIRLYGNESGKFKISDKWKFLIDAPFKISE
jgi:3'-phosphoadenosine 5'-phosphosulfate sulfotransferase (PAPS reductase)/FAD synthetase